MIHATDTLTTINPRQIAEVKRLYRDADEAARKAVVHVGTAVRIAHDCGTALLAIRAEYPETRGKPPADGKMLTRGSTIRWTEFVERTLGFNYEVANRYMRLAKTPLDQLADVGSIRQAYRLTGVLPVADSSGRGDGRVYDPLAQLTRLTGFLEERISAEPPDRWEDRDALKERLRPLVDLYAKL